VLGHGALGGVGQGFGLRKKIQSLHNFGIGFSADLHAFILTESVNEDLRFDVRPEPVVVIDQVGLGVGNRCFGETCETPAG